MKKRSRKKRPYRHRRILRRRIRIAIVASAALLILCTLCGVTFFLIDSLLKVKDVRVTGKSIYTAEDIEKTSGVVSGDNLLAVNTGKIAKKIAKELPFVEKAMVLRELPDKLRINIVPADPAAVVAEGQYSYIISMTGKVLELTNDEDVYSLPRLLRNESKTEPAVGEQMPFENDLQQKIQVDILQALSNNNIISNISTIDLRDAYEIKLGIDGRIDVLMGDYSDIDEKVRFLVKIYSDIDQTEKGTIDVSNSKKASFIPKEG